jgi:DNA polymerase-3 subunit delta'
MAMAETDVTQSDQIPGWPHPREAARLFGHAQAEAQFLDAAQGTRMHHGWLITGPRGIGKATLAWRLARFLLAQPQDDGLFGAPPPATSLDVAPDHPVARRMLAGSEPGLMSIRRMPDDKGKVSAQIRVDDVRRLRDFFGLTQAEGGRRVVIIDAADEMNPSAANAILKLLEEPPKGAVLMLVAHQPSALLPTIRSRCRELRLRPLTPRDMADALTQAGAEVADPVALAELSGGSVGEALRLMSGDGLAVYAQIVALLAGLPQMPRADVLKLADACTARGAEGRFDLTVRLVDLALSRLARAGASGQPLPPAAPGEAGLVPRLAPDARAARLWAELAADLGARARAGRAVNLDPAALVLDMFLRMERAMRSGRLA